MSSPTEFQWKRPRLSMVIASCLSTTAILLASCGGDKEEAKSRATEAPAVSVVVAPVVQKTVPLLTELTARTDATETVDVRAQGQGIPSSSELLRRNPGQAGQVLFTLDKREYEAQLMQAQAQMAKAQADLTQAKEKSVVETAKANVQIALAQLNKADQDVKRLKPLAEIKAVPQQDYDDALALQQAAKADVEGRQAALNTSKVNQTASIQQAQAAVEAANATIRQAKLNLEYCTVTSPDHRHRRHTAGDPRQSCGTG